VLPPIPSGHCQSLSRAGDVTAHPGKLPRALPARGALRSFAPVGDTRAERCGRACHSVARRGRDGRAAAHRSADPAAGAGCAATLPGARPQAEGFTRGRGVAPNAHGDSRPRDVMIGPGEGTRVRARATMDREPANQARPSCCIRESWSLLPHRSTSFAPSNRLICKPCTENDLPVGGCPWKGPSWVPLSV